MWRVGTIRHMCGKNRGGDGVRNWFDVNLMIMEINEKNTLFFLGMIRGCRVVLCVIYLKDFLSYLKITLYPLRRYVCYGWMGWRQHFSWKAVHVIYCCSLLDNIFLSLASLISRHGMLITMKGTLTKGYIISWCSWNMINLWL